MSRGNLLAESPHCDNALFMSETPKPSPNPEELSALALEIIHCSACARLRKHCLSVAQEKRRAYIDETYWGKPVPGFGDPEAKLVIVGLAPAAHGANRTGRIFTGDRSGEWLYRALHKVGFANQAESFSKEDGLQLYATWITCAVHCAPPENKPLPSEVKSCAPFLKKELQLLQPRTRVYIALGGIALKSIWPLIAGEKKPVPLFKHGEEIPLKDGRTLLLSYHPSQQNTFTGRLTEPMFDAVFKRARELMAH